MLLRWKGILVLFFMLVCHRSYGQTTAKLMHRGDFRFYKEAMITTQDSSIIANGARLLIFRQSGKYILFTTCNLFQQDLKEFISEYHISWDRELLAQMKHQTDNPLIADEIAQTPLAKMRVDLRVASLLQQGKCLVYNKQTKTLERNIVVKWYRSGKKCIAEGKIFYVRNSEILVTQEL